MKGWIKLHRSITKWEWWSDHNTARLFIYLLLEANHEDMKYKGMVIGRGQVLTSIRALSTNTGISVRGIRTSLSHLISTQEITHKPTHRFTIITICKYEDYQLTEEDTDTQTDTNNDNQPTQHRHSIKQELKNNISSSTPTEGARACVCEDEEQNFYFDAYNSAVWREWVQMQVKIEQEQISAYIDEFHAFCQMAEKRHHSRADYQIHFVSWLKKQLAKETTQQQTNKTFTHGNNRSKKCFTIDEIDAIVQAGIGNADTERG